MTTLTFEIPYYRRNFIADIIKKEGGTIIEVTSYDDLSEAEFNLLKESYQEALQIKDGKIKSIPISQLWND
jgi:hypothetical protein